jgi:hypothetical protein
MAAWVRPLVRIKLIDYGLNGARIFPLKLRRMKINVCILKDDCISGIVLNCLASNLIKLIILMTLARHYDFEKPIWFGSSKSKNLFHTSRKTLSGVRGTRVVSGWIYALVHVKHIQVFSSANYISPFSLEKQEEQKRNWQSVRKRHVTALFKTSTVSYSLLSKKNKTS